MNLLLFEDRELCGSLLQFGAGDRRAVHVTNVLGLSPGDVLRVGMINGGVGKGVLVSCSDRQMTIKVELAAQPPARSGIELILALPRPIMLQRILKQATVLGVRRFHLIRSQRVQKSFFQSAILQPTAVRELLVQGLEQAMDTCLPEMHLHPRFRSFMEDILPAIDSDSRLLAHPGNPSLAGLPTCRAAGPKMLLAIGPEGGWNDYEVECFLERGFTPFSPGRRILHVDTAVVALLAQLQLLQDLALQMNR